MFFVVLGDGYGMVATFCMVDQMIRVVDAVRPRVVTKNRPKEDSTILPYSLKIYLTLTLRCIISEYMIKSSVILY